MKREKQLIKNTFLLSLGTFLPKLAALVTLPILTGCLTKREYGMYDLVTVLVSFLLPAITLQIQTAAFRYLIDNRENTKEIGKIITNTFVFIIPISILALIVLFFLLSSWDIYVRIWICLYFFSDIMLYAARQIVRGLSRNMDYSISAIINSIGNLVFTVLFIKVWGLKFCGCVAVLALSTTISLIYLLLKVRIYEFVNRKYIDISVIKNMINYSWPMVTHSLSTWIVRMSDRFVVTFFLGVSANAIYSVANKIPSLLTIAQNTFAMAWQENASIASKDEDAEGYYSEMFGVIFNVMAGFASLLIGMTPILFCFLIRGNYSQAYVHIPILFMGVFFFSMASYMGGIYVAYMKTKNVSITTIVAAGCNLIIDLCLIRLIGLYAASISTMISYFILCVYRMFDAKRFINIKYNYKYMFKVCVLLFIQCILCFKHVLVFDVINLLIGFIVFGWMNRVMLEKILLKSIHLLKKE